VVLRLALARRKVSRVNLHSGLYALTYVLAGALLFIFALLCSIGLVVEERCGATFGYYGCSTSTADIRK
jgi:hypothetical protein